MPVSDLDIWRSAKAVIDQHGPGAWIYAANKIRELTAAGDTEGAGVWGRIAAAIAQLDDMEASDATH
jgi:hypothetical protein